jgi:hypothetical protein
VLTEAEAAALIKVRDRVRSLAPKDDIHEAFKANLLDLAVVTAPERALLVSRWTYIDPLALRRAAQACCGRTA